MKIHFLVIAALIVEVIYFAWPALNWLDANTDHASPSAVARTSSQSMDSSAISASSMNSPLTISTVDQLWPASGSVADIANGFSVSIYVQVYKVGITDGIGQGQGIECQVYLSPVTAFGGTWNDISTISMEYFSDAGLNDKYRSFFTPMANEKYEFTARCSDDGEATWIWSALPGGNGKLQAVAGIGVSGTSSGTNTGKFVYAGMPVTISATGSVNTYPEYAPNPWGGPDGNGNSCVSECLLPSGQFGALIGRIGGGGLWFFVGDSLTFSADRSGELFLAINDTIHDNNDGSFAVQVTAQIECNNTADTDGDVLLDGWELCGYDANGDGDIDVNLPVMGANPFKKDIFVEIDYMVDHGTCQFGICAFGHSHKPKAEAINKVVQAFANAPVSNPDSSTGIALHVEVSDEIPHQTTFQPANHVWDWSGFDRIKSTQGHFDPNRARIFHYVIFAHDLGGGISAGTSGISRNDASSDTAFRHGASDLVVSLGTGWSSNVNEQAGTFMHELGHNLGLRHGGDDHQSYEPNYLSVMNYSFQTSGLISNTHDGLLDYSRFDGIPPLNEAHLDETVGLNGGAAIAGYGTRYYCRPLGSWQNVRVEHANNAINWDCLLGAGGTDVQANINDGQGLHPDSTLSMLTGFADWPALVFDGGAIGPDTGTAIRSPLTASSIPTEELTFETDSQFYKPYKIVFSGGGDVVASLNISATTFITLTNLGTLTATVPISYIPGTGWFDLSAAPISVTLAPSASLSIPITLTVPVSRSGTISDSVFVSAFIQESPLMGDSAILNARIGPLARYVAEPVRGNKPLTVTFGDASIGIITDRLWDFGDGATSTLPSPTHTYTAAGAYTVTLTVNGPDGSDKEIEAALIQVYEPTHAAFVGYPITGVVPLVVTFTNQSTGAYSESLWDFGDGLTSTLQSPTHTYTNADAYTITLNVSGLGGADTLTRTSYVIATKLYRVYLPIVRR